MSIVLGEICLINIFLMSQFGFRPS